MYGSLKEQPILTRVDFRMSGGVFDVGDPLAISTLIPIAFMLNRIDVCCFKPTPIVSLDMAFQICNSRNYAFTVSIADFMTEFVISPSDILRISVLDPHLVTDFDRT